MSKNSASMLGVLAIVLLLVMFVLVSLSSMMSEVEEAIPPVNTNGGTTEDPIEGETGGDAPGEGESDPSKDEEHDPPKEDVSPDEENTSNYVSYTRSDFEVRSPIFTMGTTDMGTHGGIGFRAHVSGAYKAALDSKSVTLRVVISPYDTIMKVDASAAYVDWVDELKKLQASVDYVAYQIINVVNGFEASGSDYVAKVGLLDIAYDNVNTVMVGIPYVQYSDGTRHYAYVPEDDSYKTIARSYAYLCSEAYTKMVCDGAAYSEAEKSAFQEGLLKSVNLASGKAESELDSTLQFTLSLDTTVKTLKVGEVLELVKAFVPEVELCYTWRTANEAIASMYEGFVVATAVGNTKVTVHMGELTATCVVSVIDDTCETVTCEYCKHVYYPGDVEACPACGFHVVITSVICHCGLSISRTGKYDGDNQWVGGDTQLTCAGCGCVRQRNDLDLFELLYDCREYIAVSTETKTATCECCTATITWEVEINCYGDRIIETLGFQCPGCTCEYSVNEDNAGSTLTLLADCEGQGFKTHTETREGYCVHCYEILTWEIECYPNGTWSGNAVFVECTDAACACEYLVTGDGSELNRTYDCIADATHIETRSAVCVCCGSTVSWEITCNASGEWISDVIDVTCSACECEYWVGGDGSSLSEAMHCYDLEHTICEGCGETYCPIHGDTCPACGFHVVVTSVICHCGFSISRTGKYDGDNKWIGGDTQLTCSGCGCMYQRNDLDLFERTYDCIADATHMETREATCEHCEATISWDTLFDGNGTWVSDSLSLTCECRCEYFVTGNGDILALWARCPDGIIICHGAVCEKELTAYDGVTCESCGTVHARREAECECCLGKIVWYVIQDDSGNWGLEWYVTCFDCGCEYQVTGANGDILEKILSCS